MRNKQNPANTKAARGGDTSRSSSQGRKSSSGGEIKRARKGNPEIDENSKSEVSEQNNEANPKPRRR